MIVFVIIAVLFFICLIIGLVFHSENEKNIAEATSFAITQLYMDGKIDFDTYLGYTLQTSEKAQQLQNKENFMKYKSGKLYPDNMLAEKIDRDLSVNKTKH